MLEKSFDRFNGPVYTVRSRDLNDIDSLIAEVRRNGGESGCVKMRLHPDDRDDTVCFKSVMSSLQKKILEEKYDSEKKRKVLSYMPDGQVAFKAAIDHDVFEYTKVECTAEEQLAFVTKAAKPESYVVEENCCTKLLSAEGLDKLTDHLFGVLRSSAHYNKVLEDMNDAINLPIGDPIVYGAGIQLDRRNSIKICRDFSLSKLKGVVNDFPDKIDGLAYPYTYVGTLHSFFAWHVEDLGLFSTNYLVRGPPKMWYFMAPRFYGTASKLVSTLRIDPGHASCLGLLVGHKFLVACPVFFNQNGIPTSTVIQEAGDFIITLPFALHSGFNLGHNLAMAVNHADKTWIEEGLYTPPCVCNPTQINLNFVPLLKKHRPDLLKMYLTATALPIPSWHPRCILDLPSPSAATANNEDTKETEDQSKVELKGIKQRVLVCPKCNSSFQGNKMVRLINHIQTRHLQDFAKLKRIVEAKYPPWQPKTLIGHKCNVCLRTIRGSRTHLKQHQKRFHSDVEHSANNARL